MVIACLAAAAFLLFCTISLRLRMKFARMTERQFSAPLPVNRAFMKLNTSSFACFFSLIRYNMKPPASLWPNGLLSLCHFLTSVTISLISPSFCMKKSIMSFFDLLPEERMLLLALDNASLPSFKEKYLFTTAAWDAPAFLLPSAIHRSLTLLMPPWSIVRYAFGSSPKHTIICTVIPDVMMAFRRCCPFISAPPLSKHSASLFSFQRPNCISRAYCFTL